MPIELDEGGRFAFECGYLDGAEAGFVMKDSGRAETGSCSRSKNAVFGTKARGRVPTWYDRGFVKGVRDALTDNVRVFGYEPLKEVLAHMEANGFDGRNAVLYEQTGAHRTVKPCEGTLWRYSDMAGTLGCAKVVFLRVRDTVIAYTGEGEPNDAAAELVAPAVPRGRCILIPADQVA